MRRDVAMQDSPPTMFNYEEAVQHAEADRRHREEIQSQDHLAMILHKGQSALCRAPAATQPTEVAGHGAFREGEAKLLQFTVNFRSSPLRVLVGHAPDEIPDL